MVALLLIISKGIALAHCDTMDGPLVSDARKAIMENNVNYILKWIPQSAESEVRDAFHLTMKVRPLNSDARELADKYLFDVVVRIHRAAEGVPFTGVKPSGTPVDEKILAADKSVEVGNLSPLNGKIPQNNMAELKRRFDKVMLLKNYDVNNVEAGRKYISAYVQFFKFAEGEEDEHHEEHSSALHGENH